MNLSVKPRLQPRFPRVLGTYDDQRPGPEVVIVGGIHGNEPAGLHAGRRVLQELERRRLPLRGKLTILAGNLGALARNERYLSQDLNRRWSRKSVEELQQQPAAADSSEQCEQRQMLEILEPLVSGAKPAVFLDLHSFSAPGTPFTVMGDTLSNRKIAFQLPIPIILGLEETLQGTLLEYLGDHGQIALAVEGGSHQDPRTIDRHEAVIWMALVAAGCLKEHQVERFADHHRELAQCSTSKPRVVEILHRHEITPADRFVMRPGYVNFQPVQENEVLAHDREGEVRSPRSALLLMPLYQKQGAEGFFLSQPVRQFWLTLSAVLRYLHLAPVACWFPGVQRHPEMPLALRVNRRVARWWVREIFHLLGYRHVRSEGEQEIYLRRHEARS